MEGQENTSSVENTEASNVADNSQQEDLSLQEQISKVLDEPDEQDEESEDSTDQTDSNETIEDEQNKQDNTIECPEKFKNKDGSVNVNNLLKSYTDLESYSSKQKTDFEKERAEFSKVKEQLDQINQLNESKAQEAGYASAQDMQQVYDIAYTEANEYAKYLQYTDDPEAVRTLLINYANNPTKELMEEIELEFAPEINKRVAIVSDRQKQVYETQKQQSQNATRILNIEKVVNESVKSNRELFNYAPFKNLFANMLDKFGDKISVEDASALMSMVTEMRNLYNAEFEKQYGIKQENKEATDALSAMNNSSSAPATKQLSNSDLEGLSDSELRKEIRKYI